MSNLLPNPRIGSANPSASLSALWGYIQPALDHILRSPVVDLSKAPAVDVNYHIGIHTALYNYFTNHASPIPTPHPLSAPRPTPRAIVAPTPLGCDVYDRLDAYLADVAREVLLGAPTDDSALLYYLVPRFTRYSTGAQSINRLLNYVNRQYVRRAADEDRGWLRVGDIITEVAEGATNTNPESRLYQGPGIGMGSAVSHKKITEKMRERRAAELRRWGAPDGATTEQLARAEACAEAASELDRIVPILSLAYRRFRTEVLEPLLVVPKAKGKGKKRGGGGGGGGRATADVPATEDEKAAVGPRGRLARAVKELLESRGGGDGGERDKLASEMANMLTCTGIRPDHPLRRRLRKYSVLMT
ncbi:hypothetical protein BJY52DRAFT_282272 [Lactarius psammicola]|nr:hypothetical protein BJY52DRAFT_282272 [Lactarius psammicola]